MTSEGWTAVALRRFGPRVPERVWQLAAVGCRHAGPRGRHCHLGGRRLWVADWRS